MAIAQKHSGPSLFTAGILLAVKGVRDLIHMPKMGKSKTQSQADSKEQVPAHKKSYSSKVKAHKAKAYKSKVKAHAKKKAPKKKTTSKSHAKPHAKHHVTKAHEEVTTENKAALNNPNAVNPFAGQDPAHSPGHRKLDVRNEFADSSGEKVQIQDSALNHMTRADQIDRATAQKRINGFVSSAGQRRRRGSKTAH